MKWVLIVTYWMYGANVGVTMHDFDTQQACINASKAVIEAKSATSNGMGGSGAYRCVPKG